MVEPTGPVVFLDLDGCLVDSSRAIPAAMNRALAEMGLPGIDADEIRRLIGPPLEAFAGILMDRVGAPRTLAEPFAATYLAQYRSGMVRESTVYEGIPAALQEMARTARLAVVTLKRETLATQLIDALDLRPYLASVIGADGTEVDKAPLLDRAIDVMRPSRAAMVGDQPIDVAAAERAGIPAIGVAWGFGAVPDLLEAGAFAIARTPRDLPGAVSAALGPRAAGAP